MAGLRPHRRESTFGLHILIGWQHDVFRRFLGF